MTILSVFNRVLRMSVITDKGLQVGLLYALSDDTGRISTLVINPMIRGLLENPHKDRYGNFLILLEDRKNESDGVA